MAEFYENIVRPSLFGLSAETAHEFGIGALRVGLASATARNSAAKMFGSPAFPELKRFGLSFLNPLGMAAGFDKNGVVVDQLASLGFGFVEVGTVTFKPQEGNAKPRMFRLPEDGALLNRLGFNNDGAAEIAKRLTKIARNCIVGVNIGKNRDVPIEEAAENYLASFNIVHPVADYIAVNVSSPNTPNLRELQNADNLDELLTTLQRRNRELSPKPLLVKIAPDLTESEIEQIVESCLRLEIAGIIATNTTVSREGLRTSGVEDLGGGGISGSPVAAASNAVIAAVYRYSNGRLPIIGVGGIFNADDAFAKIAAGASLVQAYTGFIYKGPSFARDINEGIKRILRERGFRSLDEAVGCSQLG